MSEIFTLPKLAKGRYQHYKGNLYDVLGIGRHTEADDYFVVYAPVEAKEGTPEIWIRPYDMFMETVEVDGEVIPRFKHLPDDEQ